MAQKYSINSSGYIVAERDIYSLGGFIPKGSVGCKVANGDQISQEGECWVVKGDISTRPDFRVKDNAYLGEFVVGTSAVYTDGIKELSGNTLIPGPVCFRTNTGAAYSNCDMFVKDSFIGVTMDVLCGPAATTTAFPFEQGRYNHDAPAGTLFTSPTMKLDSANLCRTTANIRLGKDTYLYIPTGYTCRVLWGYRNTSGQLAYSGESFAVSQALTKLDHPTYRMAMVHISKTEGTAITPTDLLATGAKILGHVSGSVRAFLNAISASGTYFFENCRAVWNVSDFSFSTDRHAMFAGYARNCNMTFYNSADLGVFGRFSNIERLDLYRLATPADYSNMKRDTFVTASDCPLLRVTAAFQTSALKSLGNLVLRRCIVSKAEFQDDVVNGNTYEDIDFSYANEDLGFTMEGYTRFISSHKRGIYRLSGGPSSTGFASHKGNLSDTARLFQAEEYIPLDGSIIEQGTYYGETVYYENAKHDDSTRVRTKVPLPTKGAIFPTLPMGFGVRAILYLDENFVCKLPVTEPTTIETTYPYYVIAFRRENLGAALTVKDFIALNIALRITDYTKAPEITGSAYVGAGCTVRGDVQLHGDPYVNRVFDVNMWERKALSGDFTNGWEGAKIERPQGDRMLTVGLQDIGGNGATVSCATGYWILPYRFNRDGLYVDNPGWTRSHTFGAFDGYVGILIKKSTAAADNGGLITKEDLALANVKYVRAFKKRRYIVNELDRTSPEDILLGPDYWEQGYVDRVVGSTYEALKSASVNYVRLRLPVNTGRGATATQAAGYGRITISLDSLTKCVSTDAVIIDGTPLCGAIIRRDPLAAMSLADVPSSRFKIDFTPSPRIVTPYGSSALFISGPKIRMYDNAVLSRNLDQRGEIVLQGDAVMGYDFNSGSCMCSNGHHDAIIKLP